MLEHQQNRVQLILCGKLLPFITPRSQIELNQPFPIQIPLFQLKQNYVHSKYQKKKSRIREMNVFIRFGLSFDGEIIC